MLLNTSVDEIVLGDLKLKLSQLEMVNLIHQLNDRLSLTFDTLQIHAQIVEHIFYFAYKPPQFFLQNHNQYFLFELYF